MINKDTVLYAYDQTMLAWLQSLRFSDAVFGDTRNKEKDTVNVKFSPMNPIFATADIITEYDAKSTDVTDSSPITGILLKDPYGESITNDLRFTYNTGGTTRTLKWGYGAVVAISTGDGDYVLQDENGNRITATVDESALPSTDQVSLKVTVLNDTDKPVRRETKQLLNLPLVSVSVQDPVPDIARRQNAAFRLGGIVDTGGGVLKFKKVEYPKPYKLEYQIDVFAAYKGHMNQIVAIILNEFNNYKTLSADLPEPMGTKYWHLEMTAINDSSDILRELKNDYIKFMKTIIITTEIWMFIDRYPTLSERVEQVDYSLSPEKNWTNPESASITYRTDRIIIGDTIQVTEDPIVIYANSRFPMEFDFTLT